jgi:phosphatidylserine/phosphatidylglycerophosphate/cardiolipin synthase-like enzyme
MIKVDNILFLKPNDPQTSRYVLNLLIEKIRAAKEVKICVAYFTHTEIADALIARTKEKRKTQIILNLADILRPDGGDTSTIKTSQALVNIFNSFGRHSGEVGQFFQMKTLGRDKADTSQMHHKFSLFDDVVAFGSLNFTFQAFTKNYENVHFSSEEYLAGAFHYEFDNLWSIAKDFFVQDGKIRSLECPECKTAEGVDFESYGAFCTFCAHKFHGTGF